MPDARPAADQGGPDRGAGVRRPALAGAVRTRPNAWPTAASSARRSSGAAARAASICCRSSRRIPQHPIARWLTEDPQALRPTIVRRVHRVAQPRRDRDHRRWRSGARATARAPAGSRSRSASRCSRSARSSTSPAPTRTCPDHGRCCATCRSSAWRACRPGLPIVAAIGVAVLMAGALAALGARWPHRRRQIGALVGACCWCSSCGRRRARCTRRRSRRSTIASPPTRGRCACSSLPFGVRDGTWETGNFRPRSQFNQTRHGKALIGGYLSRVSPRRVEQMRQDYPTLDALITLSERAADRSRGRGAPRRARRSARHARQRRLRRDRLAIHPARSRAAGDRRAQADRSAARSAPDAVRSCQQRTDGLAVARTVAPKRAQRMILSVVMRRGPFLILFAVSGAAALIYEVVWTRLLTLHMGHGLAAASTVLAAFMGGLAAGAGAAGRYAGTLPPRRALTLYAALEIAIARARGADAVAADRRPSAARRDLRRRQRRRDVRVRPPGDAACCCCACRRPCMGATFPIASRWIVRTADDRGAGCRRAVCRQHAWRRGRRRARRLRADSGARIARHDLRRRRAQSDRGRRRVDARSRAAIEPEAATPAGSRPRRQPGHRNEAERQRAAAAARPAPESRSHALACRASHSARAASRR